MAKKEWGDFDGASCTGAWLLRAIGIEPYGNIHDNYLPDSFREIIRPILLEKFPIARGFEAAELERTDFISLIIQFNDHRKTRKEDILELLDTVYALRVDIALEALLAKSALEPVVACMNDQHVETIASGLLLRNCDEMFADEIQRVLVPA